MAGKQPINENELDELLRQLYLEKDSGEINEANANFVLEQDYPVSINSAKEKKLIARLIKTNGFGGYKLYLTLFVIASLIALIFFYFYSNKNTTGVNDSKLKKNESVNLNESGTVNSNEQKDSVPTTDIDLVRPMDTFGRPRILSNVIFKDSLIADNNAAVESKVNTEKSVPYLTDKDKAKYRKIKEQIISKLLKSDKGLYTHLPAVKISYAGKQTILDPFSIRNVAITNLEYKSFLADLLSQNRNEDYFKAQVYPENWAIQNCTNLSNTYYQEEKYNDYPVVNISIVGAKLFCEWLQEETKLYIKQNNLKLKPLEIRLPYDEEWIFAAREGYAKIAFEKGYNTIYDETEGLVDKSFTNRAELVKKRVKRVDTLYNLFTTNRYGWNEKEITEFFGIGFKYYNSISVDTIYPDRMKVLGKIGRVSEMVNQRNSQKIWLSGLSWKSKEEYLKLESEFKSNTASPFVGFRFVIINPNDPEYKNPFW